MTKREAVCLKKATMIDDDYVTSVVVAIRNLLSGKTSTF